ncbi:peptide ABC transporter substrate-binding protein [Kiloniella sp. b19]|uniref:peptide ABC transporter substrate-binding protein n=1 Tax=Kiloniella sp. GXU_MW_B19 TaxID=3141326 RepID=UPI0031E43DA7
MEALHDRRLNEGRQDSGDSCMGGDPAGRSVAGDPRFFAGFMEAFLQSIVVTAVVFTLVLLVLWAVVALTSVPASAGEMVFRRGNGAEPGSLDPQISEGVPSANILRDLFEGLTASDAKGEIVPGQAEAWTVNEDGTRYIFKIRNDAFWSNGDPVTAGDFVYAWQRALAPATGSEYSFLLFPIKNARAIASGEITDLSRLGAKALGNKTLEVHLEGAVPYLLGMLNHSVAYPVHRKTVESHGEQWTRPENMVSNGAFELVEWTPQSRIVLKKSDHYWDREEVKLDKVLYYPIENAASELKRYRAGELDVTGGVPLDQIRWVRENLGDEFRVSNSLSVFYLGFNMTRPPFDNAKLREAFSRALNRDILTEKIILESAPAYSFVVPGVNDYDPVFLEFREQEQAQRDLEAYGLYQEAGYSRDNPLEVELRYTTSENGKKLAVAIASMWKKALGVKVNLVNEEWKVFLETIKRKRETEVFMMGWVGDYNDANTFLELWASSSGLNNTGFSDRRFDKLLERAGQELDRNRRKALLADAERVFLESHAVAPMTHGKSRHLIKPYVRGWHGNVMDHVRSQYISVEK